MRVGLGRGWGEEKKLLMDSIVWKCGVMLEAENKGYNQAAR